MIIVFTKIGFYIQMQLLDFLGIITFRRTNWKSSLICSTKKRGKLKRKNGLLEKILSEIARGVQKTFDMFIETLRKVKARAYKYVPRFKTPKASPYTGDKLTEIEKISYQRPAYRGDIRHLFLFYPFDEKLDAWERENYPQNDSRVPLCKIARALVIMCKKRIALYTNLITDLEEKPALAELCGFQSIPTAKVFSRVMDENRMGIEPFRELFYDLSETSRSLGLWKGRLIGLDGSLIESNTSSYKNKKTGEYTDKDAGLYIRGSYIKGVGHLAYKVDDLEYGLPVLIQRYKGSSNENPLFSQAIDEFRRVYGFYPKIISVDRGMDSAGNNEYAAGKGIDAYIQARDFGTRELVKTEKGKCFRSEYISVNDPAFLERIADRRSESERSFSRDKWGYRRDKMSNRGAREAELYMLITGITTHLTAITAYYVGRTDLVRSPTAFSRIFPE
jgi:hypothetical protein